MLLCCVVLCCSWALPDVLHQKYHFSREESEQLASFLLPMLEYNSSNRATAREMLSHRWLIPKAIEEDEVADGQRTIDPNAPPPEEGDAVGEGEGEGEADPESGEGEQDGEGDEFESGDEGESGDDQYVAANQTIKCNLIRGSNVYAVSVCCVV